MAIKNILISQPQTSELYESLKERFDLNMTFKPFIEIREVSSNEFRKTDIIFSEHTSVIMTSKYSVDNYFRIADEVKFKVPIEMKYFCLTEQVAHYLKKHIVYRKRKIFSGKKTFDDLVDIMKLKGAKEKFFFPTSNLLNPDLEKKLKKKKIKYQKVILYETVSSNLKKLDINSYDVILFFTPLGIESLFENFPDFKQENTSIGIFGEITKKKAKEKGLVVNIESPTNKFPSMATALENAIEENMEKDA